MLDIRLGLSPAEAGLGLQVYDARAVGLEDTCPLPPVCIPLSKYRTFDGSCNNLVNPNWGRALTPLERHLPPEYEDGTSTLWLLWSFVEGSTNVFLFFLKGIWSPKWGAPGRELPNVRAVRSVIVTDENHPVADMTHMVMQWGQFIDHDMTHVPVFRTGTEQLSCCK